MGRGVDVEGRERRVWVVIVLRAAVRPCLGCVCAMKRGGVLRGSRRCMWSAEDEMQVKASTGRSRLHVKGPSSSD